MGLAKMVAILDIISKDHKIKWNQELLNIEFKKKNKRNFKKWENRNYV